MKKAINIICGTLLVISFLLSTVCFLGTFWTDWVILNVLIIAILLAVFVTTILLLIRRANGKKTKLDNALLIICSILLCVPLLFGLFLLLLAFLLGRPDGAFYVLAAVVVIFVAMTVALFAANVSIKKGFFLGAISLLTATVLACVGVGQYNRYLDSITLKGIDAIDVNLYTAFDPNANIARLQGEASLKFGEDDDLPVVDGAAALFPMYSAFVEATYPASKCKLNGSNSPYQYNNTVYGYRHLIEGHCDILFAAAPSEEQLDMASDQGVELELIPIGKEGFIFFTNVKNKVDNLSVEQVKGIYSGEVTNWKEVGGKNKKITAYQRNENSGSQTALQNFMGDTPLMTPPEVVNSMVGIIERVAYRNQKGSIGFSFRYYSESIVANKKIKILSIDGVYPTIENIKNGSYPIVNEFYMVVRKGERTDQMNRLIDWVLSEQGQYLVQQSGYAPIN